MASSRSNPFQFLSDYDIRHLPEHLSGAERFDDLHRILKCTATPKGNAWYEIKDSLIGTAEYLADLRRAWASGARLPEGVPYECRYGLMISSINSLAGNTPAPIVAAFVRLGVWTLDRAFAYARQHPEAAERTQALAYLVPHVNRVQLEDLLRETLDGLWDIEAADKRAECLLLLLNNAPEPRPHFLIESVLVNARRANSPYARNHALRALALASDHFTARLAEQAADICSSWGDTTPERIARLVSEPRKGVLLNARLAEARKRSRDDPAFLVTAAIALDGKIPRLEHRKIVMEAFHAIINADSGPLKSLALSELVPLLTATDRERALREALSSIEQQLEGLVTPEVLGNLALHVPSARTKLLSVARSIPTSQTRMTALCYMVPSLTPGLQNEVLDELIQAAGHPGGSWIAERVDALVRYMTSEQRNDLMNRVPDGADAVIDGWTLRERVQALVALSAQMTGHERERALHLGLKAVTTSTDSREHRRSSLCLIAPVLTRELLDDVLSFIQVIDDGADWLPVLPTLFVDLSETCRMQAWSLVLDLTRGAQNEWLRIDVLEKMFNSLPRFMHQELLTMTRRLEEPSARIKALSIIAAASHSDPNLLFEEACLEVRGIDDPITHCRCLVRLLPAAPMSSRVSFVKTVKGQLDELGALETKADLMMEVAPFLPKQEFEEWLVKQIEQPQPYQRGRNVIETVAAGLPEHAIRSLLFLASIGLVSHHSQLEIYRRLPSPKISPGFVIDEKLAALEALLVRLSHLGYMSDAVDLVRRHSEAGRAILFAALAPQLAADDLRGAFDETLRLSPESLNSVQVSKLRRPRSQGTTLINGADAHEYALAGFCPWIARAGWWETAHDCAQGLHFAQWRAEALTELLPYAPPAESSNLFREALDTIQHDESERAIWLPSWGAYLARTGAAKVAPLVSEALLLESQKARKNMIGMLCAISPALTAIGSHIPGYVLDSVEDVIEWWP